MNIRERVLNFWNDVILQDAEVLESYFDPEAQIRWHNTNECFTVSEYIIANCEYPGNWCGEVERIEVLNDLVITVTRIWLADNSASFHATSFIKVLDGKIISLDEYYGDDGLAPQWRCDKKIGKQIK